MKSEKLRNFKSGDVVDIYTQAQTKGRAKWWYNMTIDKVYDTHIAFIKENGKRYVIYKPDIMIVKFH